MKAAPPALRVVVDRVGKQYGPRRVLHNLAAELGPGEVLLVTGRNGSGKSTLLRLLAGLQRPSTGTLRYEADGVAFAPSRAQHLLGLVGADVQLYRELTAAEHLHFIAQLRGLPLTAAGCAQCLAEVGLVGRGGERVAGFSSGMLQRLRYALALLHCPPVLLLDEPTTNLDAAGIALVDDIVARQRNAGIVIIATNEQRDLRYGDLVLTLDG